MVRGHLRTGAFLVLVGFVLAGCSIRHPTFVPQTELAAAEADSIGVEAMQASMDIWLTSPMAWTPTPPTG